MRDQLRRQSADAAWLAAVSLSAVLLAACSRTEASRTDAAPAKPPCVGCSVDGKTTPRDFACRIRELVARHPNLATTDAGRQVVASRALASRVQVGLAMHSETRRYRFTVEAQGGVVTLEGTTALERAVDVARDVPGVKQVRTRQLEIPPIPPFVA